MDVDGPDYALAPGTEAPEPGDMTSAELLWAVREVAARLGVIGADVVEVIPTSAGSADITAPAVDRIVGEMLGGIALRHRKRNDKEER